MIFRSSESKLRLILVAVAAITVGVSVSAGTRHQQNGDVTRAKAPVNLELKVLNPTRCLGSAVGLELEIQNVGAEEIRIDRADLWASFSYGGPIAPDATSGRGGGESSGCDHCRGNYLTLLPGVAYWDKHEFKFHEFFSREGKYFISINLPYKSGNADSSLAQSNQVMVELYQCGAIQN
jgi:hypothetical protein